jgi:hypothetical protein
MKPWRKGLVIAAVQVALVASLGAKLRYDRATRPRVWVPSAPHDPELPIRGRYVSLQLVVEPQGIRQTDSIADDAPLAQPVTLRVEADRLVAEAAPADAGWESSGVHAQFIERQGRHVVVLHEPVAYFITEHVPDPSRRPAGEELWVEVTVPKKGPPRPIRLGVKKGDGPIVPLELG